MKEVYYVLDIMRKKKNLSFIFWIQNPSAELFSLHLIQTEQNPS